MEIRVKRHPYFEPLFQFNPLTPLKVVVTDPRVHEFGLPKIQTVGSAGLDLRAFWGPEESGPRYKTLTPGEQFMADTGLKIWIDAPGFVGMLYPRSSMGIKGLVLGNGTGVIDSDYQGPLKLCLFNRSKQDITIELGERVAQLVIMPVVTGYDIEVLNEFPSTTERGEGGFGHTGKQ